MAGPDPSHWLHRFSADEWLRAGMRELATARASFAQHASRTALASARRAAGMGWNAVLCHTPEPLLGQSYVDHLRALADGVADPPPEVRDAARLLLEDPAGGASKIVQIKTRSHDDRLLEAAEIVLAEAYARHVRCEGREAGDTGAR